VAVRLVYLLAGLGAGLVIGTAVVVGHAQDDAVSAAAAAAGVDVVALQGAVNTTGLDPVTYLCKVGEGACPAPPRAAEPPPGVWDRLASCESSGNWASRSNPLYKGGLQMDPAFWARYGGLAYAPRPDLAPRAVQITVAERGLAVQGWGAWPVCSRVVGLR
jgi:hypothetical protein